MTRRLAVFLLVAAAAGAGTLELAGAVADHDARVASRECSKLEPTGEQASGLSCSGGASSAP